MSIDALIIMMTLHDVTTMVTSTGCFVIMDTANETATPGRCVRLPQVP